MFNKKSFSFLNEVYYLFIIYHEDYNKKFIICYKKYKIINLK